jgi:hypothetical protein
MDPSASRSSAVSLPTLHLSLQSQDLTFGILLDDNFSKTSPDPTTRMTKIPYQISTQITTRKSKLTRSTCYGRHERYRNNLITIPSEKVTTINTNKYSSPNGKSYPTSKSSKNFVPSLMLTNVMSLAPKIDEVRPFVLDLNLDLACITETWLRGSITEVIHIPGYKVIRKDRIRTSHGGVCVFIREEINCSRLNAFESSNQEVLWLKILPKRLPRGVPCIVLGTIYHPLAVMIKQWSST